MMICNFASCFPTTETRIADFVAGADAALYAAKQSGRNSVCENPKMESRKICRALKR